CTLCPLLSSPPFSTLFPYTTLFRSSLQSSQTNQTGFQLVNLGSSFCLDENPGVGVEHLAQRSCYPETINDATAQTWYELVCPLTDRKSTRLNSSHVKTSYAVFCLKK